MFMNDCGSAYEFCLQTVQQVDEFTNIEYMTYEESEVASHNQTHWYFWHKMLSGINQHVITSYQFRPGQVLVPNLES